MSRCKHELARVVEAKANWADVFCDECQRGWRGYPFPRQARFHHFTRNAPRMIRPPKWVMRALSLEEPDVAAPQVQESDANE